ncbi:hypothetical protein [Mycetocola miduiensis]|nr:hypothetical protein [Mycetocola miduiensis]
MTELKQLAPLREIAEPTHVFEDVACHAPTVAAGNLRWRRRCEAV